MKYLININELFSVNSTSEATVIKAEMNSGSLFYGAKINLLIKDIPYTFSTQIRKFGDKHFIYISYAIFNHQDYESDKSKYNFTEYEFIVNKSMTVPVLNALPVFLEAYKKLLSKKDINPPIYGFYFDCSSDKRKNIYYYYFKNRLSDRLKDISKKDSLFTFVELKTPEILENFYL